MLRTIGEYGALRDHDFRTAANIPIYAELVVRLPIGGHYFTLLPTDFCTLANASPTGANGIATVCPWKVGATVGKMGGMQERSDL
jgi:hypothetical protein